MKQRNRKLRAAEMLVIAVFVIVFFVVEQQVVTTWFSTSMSNALGRIVSIMHDYSEKSSNDKEFRAWSEDRSIRFAAYYLENDGVEKETEDTLHQLCDEFDAWGAYIIDPEGRLITGFGALTLKDYFRDPCFRELRSVREEDPTYDQEEKVPDDVASVLGNEYPRLLSCYMSGDRILVMHTKALYEKEDVTQVQLSGWEGIFSRRVFGSRSVCFVSSQKDPAIWFTTKKDKEDHPELAGKSVPKKMLKDGFRGFVTLGGHRFYCCTKFNKHTSNYYYCAVPASALYYTTAFLAVGTFLVVLFFLLLMRMYTRLTLPDTVKKNPAKAGRDPGKNLRILLLTAVIATLFVNIFATTLFLYTERVQTNSQRARLLASTLDGFQEKQETSSSAYNAYIKTITRASASLIPQNPEFRKTKKLEELAQTTGADHVLLYDNTATVYASDRNYKGLTLSEDPDSMSYEFRWVLRGEPLLIQGKPDEHYLHTPYRFSGAPMTDAAGNYIGMVQIAMDPAVYEMMESTLSLESVLSNFATKESSVVLAVDTRTGKVFSPEKAYSDETAESLGIPKEVLKEDFTGFFYLNKDRLIGCCHNCEEYHAIVASQTDGMPSSGVRYGVLTALPGIAAEVILFLILLLYVNSCSTMDAEELRKEARDRKKDATEAGVKMHTFTYRVVVGIAAVVSVLYFFRQTVFRKGSLGYYLFTNHWEKGFHIFSIERCLIYVAVAVFLLVAVSKLIRAVGDLLPSRQETFLRMGLSFFKYAVGVVTVYICAKQLGASSASLLVSAGVLTAMFSFGAQSIVADILSGLFIIFEGTFKVGDMITVDTWHGQVVEIGIRNTKIRDLISGDVKIMNNSIIKTITNFSESPCWCGTKVGVDYKTDLPALEAIFQQEKAAMKKNIPLGIGEILYMGVDELADSQMILKFQILCRNQDINKVRRALNRELRLMLERNGIKIPFPQIVVSTRKE